MPPYFDVELHLFVRFVPSETMTSQREIEVGRDLVPWQGGKRGEEGKVGGAYSARGGERGV
jgi:hypothetical protein